MDPANTKDMVTSAVIAGAMAGRFLDDVWDSVLSVAGELVASAGDHLALADVVDVDSIREAFARATSSRSN